MTIGFGASTQADGEKAGASGLEERPGLLEEWSSLQRQIAHDFRNRQVQQDLLVKHLAERHALLLRRVEALARSPTGESLSKESGTDDSGGAHEAARKGPKPEGQAGAATSLPPAAFVLQAPEDEAYDEKADSPLSSRFGRDGAPRVANLVWPPPAKEQQAASPERAAYRPHLARSGSADLGAVHTDAMRSTCSVKVPVPALFHATSTQLTHVVDHVAEQAGELKHQVEHMKEHMVEHVDHMAEQVGDFADHMAEQVANATSAAYTSVTHSLYSSEGSGHGRRLSTSSSSGGRRRAAVGHKYVMDKKKVQHSHSAHADVNLDPMTRASRWWQGLEEPPRTGPLARCVQTNAFECWSNLVMMVTTAYTIIAANEQVSTLEEDMGWLDMAGVVLGLIYITEVLMKVVVHRFYFFINDDMAWNIFDTFLAVSEAWSLMFRILERGAGLKITFLRSLRILRITRILRLVKLVNEFKVLRLLLEAMMGSAVTVLWCTIVIVFALTISSLMFVQFVTDYLMQYPEEICMERDAYNVCERTVQSGLVENFGSVPRAALTLFMATSGGNDWVVYYNLLDYLGAGVSISFVMFTFFFQFGMFNLLTGMFVDRAMKASKPDIDMMIVEQRTKELEQATILMQEVRKFDKNGDGTMSWHEFTEMVHDDAMSSFLAAAGLDIPDAEMFFKMLAELSDHEDVPIDAFVQGCMRMKGNATSIDMQAVQFELRMLTEKLGSIHHHINAMESPRSFAIGLPPLPGSPGPKEGEASPLAL